MFKLAAGERLTLIAFAGGAAMMLASCSAPDGPTPDDLNADYETALAETSPVAIDFVSGSPDERAALASIEGYFVMMTAESVEALTADVYAEEGWLYDNLIAIKGVDNIRRYFAKAASETEELSISFLQVAKSGPDYFVRWKMTIVSASLKQGAPLVSYGVTQFRFDRDGKVLLHRDFWDAGTGLYEYLPGIGGLVARARDLLTQY
jgi:hypothetical protein